jgi:hypothetical protein
MLSQYLKNNLTVFSQGDLLQNHKHILVKTIKEDLNLELNEDLIQLLKTEIIQGNNPLERLITREEKWEKVDFKTDNCLTNTKITPTLEKIPFQRKNGKDNQTFFKRNDHVQNRCEPIQYEQNQISQKRYYDNNDNNYSNQQRKSSNKRSEQLHNKENNGSNYNQYYKKENIYSGYNYSQNPVKPKRRYNNESNFLKEKFF